MKKYKTKAIALVLTLLIGHTPVVFAGGNGSGASVSELSEIVAKVKSNQDGGEYLKNLANIYAKMHSSKVPPYTFQKLTCNPNAYEKLCESTEKFSINFVKLFQEMDTYLKKYLKKNPCVIEGNDGKKYKEFLEAMDALNNDKSIEKALAVNNLNKAQRDLIRKTKDAFMGIKIVKNAVYCAFRANLLEIELKKRLRHDGSQKVFNELIFKIEEKLDDAQKAIIKEYREDNRDQLSCIYRKLENAEYLKNISSAFYNMVRLAKSEVPHSAFKYLPQKKWGIQKLSIREPYFKHFCRIFNCCSEILKNDENFTDEFRGDTKVSNFLDKVELLPKKDLKYGVKFEPKEKTPIEEAATAFNYIQIFKNAAYLAKLYFMSEAQINRSLNQSNNKWEFVENKIFAHLGSEKTQELVDIKHDIEQKSKDIVKRRSEARKNRKSSDSDTEDDGSSNEDIRDSISLQKKPSEKKPSKKRTTPVLGNENSEDVEKKPKKRDVKAGAKVEEKVEVKVGAKVEAKVEVKVGAKLDQKNKAVNTKKEDKGGVLKNLDVKAKAKSASTDKQALVKPYNNMLEPVDMAPSLENSSSSDSSEFLEFRENPQGYMRKFKLGYKEWSSFSWSKDSCDDSESQINAGKNARKACNGSRYNDLNGVSILVEKFLRKWVKDRELEQSR